MKPEPAIERPLSPLEATVWLLDRLARLSFVMVADVAGPLTDNALRLALDAVQQRHPLLRLRVSLEADNLLMYRSAGVPPLPLRVVEAPGGAWQAEAEAEQQAGFPTETGPLFRCTLLRHAPERATLLTTFHHMIGDGLSGVFLVRDVLQAAGAVLAEQSPRLEPLDPVAPLQVAIPASERGLTGMWNYLKWLTRDHFPFLLRGFPRRMRLDAEIPVQQRRTRLVSRQLDAEATTALVQRARQERTTVHGALGAAQLLAVAHEFDEPRAVPLALGSAINLREQMRPAPREDVGFFVSLATSTHRIAPESDFWELARDVRRELTRRVERREPWTAIAAGTRGLAAFRRWIPLTEATAIRMAQIADLFGHGATGLTNLGVLPIPQRYGPLTLEALHFSGAMSALCNLGSSAATFADRLHWNFIYQSPSLATDRAERLAARAVDRLQQAVKR